jgi:hypothetical protein
LSPARAAVCADPKPIPGGLEFLGDGTLYHALAPGHPVFGTLGPDKEDPSTITDFNGRIGLAYVQGMGTHMDKTTGDVSHLPYEVDLRFMKGEYVGKDGKNHHGTFTLIWLDVFDGSGSQIHDFNPGITDFNPPDTGLFWTACIDAGDVDVNPGNGRATMSVSDLEIPDYFNGNNALLLGPSEPGVVSFHIEWMKSSDKRRFRYAPEQWLANVVINEAKAEWEAETVLAHYVSDPLATSASLFAEVGHERNGVFFS